MGGSALFGQQSCGQKIHGRGHETPVDDLVTAEIALLLDDDLVALVDEGQGLAPVGHVPPQSEDGLHVVGFAPAFGEELGE